MPPVPRDLPDHHDRGRVDFVGAGPGAADLLTLRARDLLAAADVVVHDRLAGTEALRFAPTARRIAVGKTPGGPSVPQAEIEALLVAHASAGARVVRLKGGDPAVFGRLDEEIAAVEAAGLPYAVCPGVTAACAAAAASRVSLTRRGRNTALRLVTGHDADGLADHDWAALAEPGAVTAVYMGLRAAARMAGRLIAHGADPATPVAAVRNAGRPDEAVLSLTLGRLGAGLAEAGASAPVLLLLGLAPRAGADAFDGAAEDMPTLAALRALEAAL